MFTVRFLGFLSKAGTIIPYIDFFAWAVVKLFWGAIFGLFDFWCCYNLWLCCWHLQLKFCSVGSIAPLLISVLNTRANDVICNPTTTVKPYGMYLLLFVEKTLMLWVFWTNNLQRKGYCKADKMYFLSLYSQPTFSGIFYYEWNSVCVKSLLEYKLNKSAPCVCDYTEQERNEDR